MPRRMLKQKLHRVCCICNTKYTTSDYSNLDIQIRRVMDSRDLCFKCGYWRWRLTVEDPKLISIHTNPILFEKAILEELKIDPSKLTWADMAIGGYNIPTNYSEVSFEKAKRSYLEYLFQYYQNHWHFGKPVIIREGNTLNHYIWYPDKNLYINYHEISEGLTEGAILMEDGTIFIPYICNKMSNQGKIPRKFIEGCKLPDDVGLNYLEIIPNAIRLSYVEFLDIFYQTPNLHLNEPGAVPQKILEKYFKNLHN